MKHSQRFFARNFSKNLRFSPIFIHKLARETPESTCFELVSLILSVILGGGKTGSAEDYKSATHCEPISTVSG